ncbi:sporulation protein [Laceyella putida]|uniref:Sporulation protein n=1 Tax=Laceyella putida TaxID=110101 RepID=A0ABW2RHK7_9BACL
MRNLTIIFCSIFVLAGCTMNEDSKKTNISKVDVRAFFFSDKQFPERASFFQTAFRATKTTACTLDRKNAEARNKEALKDYPPKDEYDRVEWPLAICKEGGAGAYVDYIESKKNEKAEKWLQKELSKYPDGTPLFFNMGERPKMNIIIDKKEREE